MPKPTTNDIPSARGGELATFRLPVETLASARVVSALRGVSMTVLLSGILAPILAKLEAEEVAKKAKTMAENP